MLEDNRELTDIEKILNMRDGETLFISQGEESGAEIWFKYGTYILFEVPQFGGEPRFANGYKDIYAMKKHYDGWT